MTQPLTNKYWIIHDGQTICEVSDPVLALFRCTPADLIGKDIFEIIPSPEMAQLARLRINHILSKGADLHEQDLPIKRPDGSTFWVTVITRQIGESDLFVSALTYKGEHNPDWHNT